MAAETAPYDLVIEGATVLTGGDAHRVIENAVIAIRGDRIASLGPAGPGQAPPARRVLQLPGRVVTPGFVNVHTHSALTMARGVAEDLGFAPAYTPGVPQGDDLTPEEARALARLGALEALLFGSTLINDNYVHADHTIAAMAELGLRVHTSFRIHDVDFVGILRGDWRHDRELGRRSLAATVRLAETWNGRDGGRIGVQLAPHAPDTCSDELLQEVAAAARALGLRVNTHLAQSKLEVERVRERTGRTPAELLDEVGLLDERLTAAHCIHLSEADIQRVGRAGITVAHIPKANATRGAMAPTPDLRVAGARIALATDNRHGDMVELMRWALAVARCRLGRVSEDWQPIDALRMATLEGARAMGLADEIGSIEVGKKADLVAFDFRRCHLTPVVDPLGNLVHVGQGRDVEMVIVDGRIVVEDGRSTLVDEDEIRREAQRAAEQVWARVGPQQHAGAPRMAVPAT